MPSVKSFKEFFTGLYAACTANDVTTWITHWLIVIVPCVFLAATLGVTAGAIGARIGLIAFCLKEGYEYHKGGRLLDGVMDLVGPVLTDVIFSVALYG